MIRLLFLLLFITGGSIYSQTVSTYFSNAGADVDDDMEFDSSGNLYGSNFAGDTVYKIDAAGVSTVFVDGLANPNGIAIDSDDNVFIVEFSAGTIHKYSSTGALIESYLVGSSPSGLEKSPSSDDMYFTLTSNNSVNILSSSGGISQVYQGAPLDIPVGLAFDDDENLYVGNYIGGDIHRVTLDNAVFLATVPTSGGGSSPFLAFIAYGNGKLWGTVYGAHKIYMVGIDTNDDVTLFAGSAQGSTDGPITDATFDNPGGIVFNEAQNAMYISEFSTSGNIRRIDDMPLGVDALNLDLDFVISPNPSTEFINVRIPSISGLEINELTVYDINGALLKTLEVSSAQATMNIANLPSGMYFLKVTTTNGDSGYRSFIRK
ncbi:MAG: T9SS type A sorting domain-containing protein [Flavobacteriaceae bacterium]|nr:T9SS type A sorting domain-containing protein [Flavobacteriaceae bacterium]